jgi:uncharacterized repeat protein (TIGR03803 family)
VFKVNKDGSGFSVLKTSPLLPGEFPMPDSPLEGAYPASGLVMSGDTLYGTARSGGYHGRGTIFKLNTDGTGFAVIKHFSATGWNGFANTNGDGAEPVGGLLLNGSTLFGTTSTGGSGGSGTEF